MADEIDRAQAREQLDRELAIKAQLDRGKTEGLSECCDCSHPISEARREAGARWCVPCQNGIEAEAKRRTARGCFA
jgi:RNA polymerase-binding transcription factor DksA